MFYDYYIPPETNNTPAIEVSIEKSQTAKISSSKNAPGQSWEFYEQKCRVNEIIYW